MLSTFLEICKMHADQYFTNFSGKLVVETISNLVKSWFVIGNYFCQSSFTMIATQS